jgi:hypothetical protein
MDGGRRLHDAARLGDNEEIELISAYLRADPNAFDDFMFNFTVRYVQHTVSTFCLSLSEHKHLTIQSSLELSLEGGYMLWNISRVAIKKWWRIFVRDWHDSC